MKLILFDYGAGNLHSLSKALVAAGADVEVETDPRRCTRGQGLVLPGVGAFSPAAARLLPGFSEVRAAAEDGLPVLGICLGMQLMFERSSEGPGEGLGLFAGAVTRLEASRVPHMGWNSCEASRTGMGTLPALAYFAHSYVCRPAEPAWVKAWSTHGEDRFAAVVRRKNVLGVQFHPEKSSAPGLQFLASFLAEVKS